MSFRAVAPQSVLQSWQLSAHLQWNTEDLKAPSFSSTNHGAAVIHKHFQNRGWTQFLFWVWKCVYETCLGFITRVAASSFNPVLIGLICRAAWPIFLICAGKMVGVLQKRWAERMKRRASEWVHDGGMEWWLIGESLKKKIQRGKFRQPFICKKKKKKLYIWD